MIRDLQEELKAIEAADKKGTVGYLEFIREVRAGWADMIHRALAAEARVRELEEAANKVLVSRVNMDGKMMAVSVDSLEELSMARRKGLKHDGPTT